MPLALRKVVEHLLCVAVLAGIALAALLPIFTQDAVPCSPTAILFQAPWEEARPIGLKPPGEDNSDPVTRQYYPWQAFLSDTAQRGDSILWNSQEGCGTPFMALWRSRCLSPFSIPFYLLPPVRGLQVSAFLKLLVAGLCAFAAARRLGFACGLSLFVAVVFELCSPLTSWLAWPLSDVVPWLPLLLIFVDRLALGRSSYWPWGALVFALMLLGGEPEAVAGAFVTTTLFILLRGVLGRRGLRAVTGALAMHVVTLAFGVALVGIQLVPFVEYMRHAVPEANASATLLPKLSDLAVSFLPNFFGHQGAPAQQLSIFHVGLLPLLLLPLWGALRRFSTPPQRQRIEALLLTALSMTVFVTLGWRLVGDLPGLRLLRPEHLLFGNALLFGVGAAAAAEEWVGLDAEECKDTLRRLLLWVPVFAVAGCALIYLRYAEPRPNAMPLLYQGLIAGAFSAGLLLLVVVTVLRPSMRTMGYVLSCLAAGQLLLAHHLAPVEFFATQEVLFPETSFVTALKEPGARVCGSVGLKNWPLAGNLVSQAYCPSGIQLKRHKDFFEQAESNPLLLQRTGSGTLVLTKEDILGAFSQFRPILRIKRVLPSGAAIFENLAASPRAWMAYEGRSVETFNPEELDAEKPSLMENVVAPTAGPGPEAAVTVLPSESNARVPIRVEDTRPGMLVLADAFYPGWKATVDGENTEIYAVDGMLRGVLLDEGSHDVEFSYKPRSLKTGMIVSGLALLAIAADLLVQLWRHFRAVRNRRIDLDSWSD